MSERVETDEPTYTHGGRCLGRWLQVGSTSGEVREKKYRDYPSNFDGGPTQARQKLEPTSSVGGNHAAGFSISHCLPHLPSALISHRLMPKSGRVPVEMIIAQCARATAFPKPKSLPD